jgi:drug/metabolite transporter (DMT)-like permease
MHVLGSRRFWLWAVAGALLTFSFIAAASIGLFVLPVAALATVFIARSTRGRAELFGALVGAAGICFLIAWIQRGPGGFDSRPWFAAGVALAGAGVAGYAVLARRLAPRA